MSRSKDFRFGGFAACFGPKGFAFGSGRRGLKFRVFDRGDLKYVILRLLSQKPMHGYEVMRALEEESGGCYSASPGSVYPTLQMLEDQSYVVCEEQEGKKVYTITERRRGKDDRLTHLESRVAGRRGRRERLMSGRRHRSDSHTREPQPAPTRSRRNTPVQELQKMFVEGRLTLGEYERELDRLDRID